MSRVGGKTRREVLREALSWHEGREGVQPLVSDGCGVTMWRPTYRGRDWVNLNFAAKEQIKMSSQSALSLYYSCFEVL